MLSVEDLLRVRDVYQESLGGSRKNKYLNHKSISARLDFNGSNADPMIFSDTHSVDSTALAHLIGPARAPSLLPVPASIEKSRCNLCGNLHEI